MKKLLLIISVLGLLAACSSSKDSQGTIDVSKNNFEEVEKVDIEISDYVEEDAKSTSEPTTSPVPDESITPTSPTADVKDTQAVISPEFSKEPVKAEVTKEPVTTKDPVKTEKPATPKPQVVVKKEPVDLSNKIICIDAGHGTFTQNSTEAIAPGADITKPAFTKGIVGVHTTEDAITLAVSNIVKEKLEAMGATVVMTRTSDTTDLSNAKRAEFANQSGADIIIKLHADGASKTGSGMTMLIPGGAYITDANLLTNSKNLAKHILNNSVAQTGAKNRGTHHSDDMAGLNWSKIPVVLFEMGYMTNANDEIKLMDTNYQNKIAQGIADGICDYYR